MMQLDKFNLDVAKQAVREYLASTLTPTKEEEMFWKEFSAGMYQPGLIFGKVYPCENIERHPMAL